MALTVKETRLSGSRLRGFDATQTPKRPVQGKRQDMTRGIKPSKLTPR